MKLTMNITGVLLILVGFVWSLQGANILPGSFMTGDVKWLVIGVICIVIGIGLLGYNYQRSKSE